MTNALARIVADEQATDLTYREELRKSDPRPLVNHGAGAARQARPRPMVTPTPRVNGLLGRVELVRETDIFDGSEFYIGSRYLEEKGLVVFSWAAPIASTFFRGAGHHELCPHVSTTRTLVRRGGRIVDVVDDDGPAHCPGQPFAARRLSVRRAPVRRPLPGRSPTAVPHPVREPQRSDQGGAAASSRQERSATPAVPSSGAGALRAERAVHAAITAPRQERLASVLATIQPDQYELVTADPRVPLLVQGPPGTGKTVVAAHRAAYLTHSDSKGNHRGRVLVVGPTEHYVAHIRGVLAELVEVPGTVRAMSLDDVLLHMRDLPGAVDDGMPQDFRDVDQDLGQLAERAVHLLRANGRWRPRAKHTDRVVAVYEALRANRVGTHRVSAEREWADYLTRLPALGTARTMRRCLPLLAACGTAVRGSGGFSFDHVIVDEAQDVTALEWALLMELNPHGSWTVLGDMNQRRSDWSCHTWDQVGSALWATAPRVAQLERGYRTASAIMQFAGKLLRSSERTVRSLQDGGEAPRIEKVRTADLHARAALEASVLLARYPDGTVTVISTSPQEAVRAFRKAAFTVDSRDRSRLVRGGLAVRVLGPQDVRGLEFDAAVVVEPASFPKLLNRHGLLYTSLTRANRELVIVHSDPLPDELRGSPTRTRAANSPAIPAQRVGEPPTMMAEFRSARR